MKDLVAELKDWDERLRYFLEHEPEKVYIARSLAPDIDISEEAFERIFTANTTYRLVLPKGSHENETKFWIGRIRETSLPD